MRGLGGAMRGRLAAGWFMVAVGLALLLASLAQRRGEGAPGAAARITLPGYPVGEFVEPPPRILTILDGRRTVTLQHLLHQWPDITAPVGALRLVNPRAPQTNFGRRVGAIALKLGIQGIRNGRFYRRPRIACAAFVSYVLRKAGRPGYSFAVNTLYAQVRRKHGILVASRVSTRYTPFYQWYRPGDLLFFHRGRRLGHVEIYIGGGNTVGTSSSALRLGVRRVGNRGFSQMSVVRC